MTKISNQAFRELSGALDDKITDKTKPQSSVVNATVISATKGDLWVQIDGAQTSTPVSSTSVNVNVGDKVIVRIQDGKATITGNLTYTATNAQETQQIVKPVKVEAKKALSEANKATSDAKDAKAVAEATGQNFWADGNGAHVSFLKREYWDEYKIGANLLANSLGILIRNGLNPLTGMLSDGFYIYDGQGSEQNNILASYAKDKDGSAKIDIGKTSGIYSEITSAGLSIYDGRDSNNRKLAQFGIIDDKTKIQIGCSDETCAEVEPNAFTLYDGGGDYYFKVADLREPSTGTATLKERTVITKAQDGRCFCTTKLPATQVDKLMTGNSDSTMKEVTNYTVEQLSGITTIFFPSTSDIYADVTYQAESRLCKTYTMGINRIGELGIMSYAIGSNLLSSGFYSYAEGYASQALGDYSHAEGCESVARDYAHAEGYNTKARGKASHAQGMDTEAYGSYSSAQNLGTFAFGQAQTVIGRFNVEDYENDYAFIIGNGTDDENRSNALTIDWNGNIEPAPSFLLPIASADTLGGIKVGSGLEITSEGVLSSLGKTYTAGTGLELTGQEFSHKSGSGFSHIPTGGTSGQVLSWDSDGVAKWADLPAQSEGTVKQVKVGTSGHLTVTPTTGDADTYTIEHATGDGHKHLPTVSQTDDDCFLAAISKTNDEPSWRKITYDDVFETSEKSVILTDTLHDIDTELNTKASTTDMQDALSTKADTSSLASVATSGSYNDLSNKPTSLKNPYALNIGGDVTASYDGSKNTIVEITYKTFIATIEETSWIDVSNAVGNNKNVVAVKNGTAGYEDSVYQLVATHEQGGSNEWYCFASVSPVDLSDIENSNTKLDIYVLSGDANNSEWTHYTKIIGTGGSSSASWGSITGNIGNQSDLQLALDDKVNYDELSSVATSGSYSDLSNKPTSLKNPYALQFSGAFSASYDGSSAVTVDIPKETEPTVIWSGSGSYMNASQSVDLSSNPVSSTQHGILLHWQYYNSGTKDQNHQFTFIPKTAVNSTSRGFMCNLQSINVSTGAVTGAGKYIYITNDAITGAACNAMSNNAHFVLTEVLAV